MPPRLEWIRCYPNGKRERDWFAQDHYTHRKEQWYLMNVWVLFRVIEKKGNKVGLYKLKSIKYMDQCVHPNLSDTYHKPKRRY